MTTPPPKPTTETLPDGAIRVCVAGVCGDREQLASCAGEGPAASEVHHHHHRHPMTDLSPEAQSVLDAAAASEPGIYATVIATLEAMAEVLCNDPSALRLIGARSRILAVAEELRCAFPTTTDTP